MKKLGVFCSSGGASIFEAYDIFNSLYPRAIELAIATDRDCGAEKEAGARGLPLRRFENKDRAGLSADICDYFIRNGCAAALLICLRLVSRELYGQIPTMNIHPALLPAFPGMNAVKQALAAGARFLGATLHMVNEGMDEGQIISQTALPLPPEVSLERANSISFYQKVYLCLILLESVHLDRIEFPKSGDGEYSAVLTERPRLAPYANPAIATPQLEQAFVQKMRGYGYDYAEAGRP